MGKLHCHKKLVIKPILVQEGMFYLKSEQVYNRSAKKTARLKTAQLSCFIKVNELWFGTSKTKKTR